MYINIFGQCFRYILHNPPRPLTEIDIWFQTGHVYEQQKEYELAKEAYERVLSENPDHAKVLQQLGWLYHQQNTSFSNQGTAIQYLTRSLKADSTDAQSWYLLGRCYMVEQNYNKAYEAYQQAVYRDARNPTFWCSIGVLYYQINQYRDALDAYSRAIRLNPYISEVWYDLGTLYESCNNQIQDALDAYQRASELDPSNPHIRQRLELLRKSNPSNAPVTTPIPQDVNNPYQYNNNNNHGGAAAGSQYQPPLLNGGQQQPRRSEIPRDLPPPSSNDLRSPVPFTNNTSSDVRIPDIGGGGRAPTPSERILMNPMIESRSPIYRHANTNSKVPSSVVRSPIPSKSSPRMYYHGRPPNESFPSFHSASSGSEPLRRTSVLYDTEKNNSPPVAVKREYVGGASQLPPVQQHQRHNSASSSHSRQKKESPVESSAADTLMSMSQKGYVSKKRVLEMADDEEEEEDKRPRLENNHRMMVDYNSSPSSSPKSSVIPAVSS